MVEDMVLMFALTLASIFFAPDLIAALKAFCPTSGASFLQVSKNLFHCSVL